MVVGVVALAMPSLASAKPKVALTPIDGDASGDVAEAVADALDGADLTMIATKTVTRAVDKLGYDGELTEKQAKKVGTELEADAVIQGKLDKQGSSKSLHVTLFLHGKKSKGFTVSFSNAKSKKFKSMLHDKVVAKLGIASGEPDPEAEDPKAKASKKVAEEVDDEDPVNGGKKPKKLTKKEKLKAEKAEKAEKAKEAKEAKEAEKAEKVAEKEESTEKGELAEKSEKAEKSDKSEKSEKSEDGDEVVPRKKRNKKVARVEDEDEETATLSVRKRPTHAANRVAVRLDLGMSVANRTLKFTNRGNFPEAPKSFANAPVPAARFEAEMYPLAFTNPKSLAAGLGLAVDYDKTLSLTLRTTTEATVAVKATQQHYSFGARFRIPFGGNATSPSMTLGVGYARRTYLADRSGLMDPRSLDIPDTDYKSIEPGLSFRIPLASSLAFVAGGKGMLISSAGPIQKANSYGQATVFGGSAQAGLDIVFGNRFAIRLVGEFTQIGFSFRGKGFDSNARDGNPDTPDVGGLADRSIGGAATLAVLY